jgi:hypothetical protein
MVFIQNITIIHPFIQQLRVMTKKSTLYQNGVFCKVRKEDLKCILYNEKIVMQMHSRQAVRLPCAQINWNRTGHCSSGMFCGIGWWFIIVLLNNLSESFSRVKQAKKNVGIGGCVYVCRGQYDWWLDCWESNREAVRLLEPWKWLLLQLVWWVEGGDKMSVGGHCELAIRMWGGGGGSGGVGMRHKTGSPG